MKNKDKKNSKKFSFAICFISLMLIVVGVVILLSTHFGDGAIKSVASLFKSDGESDILDDEEIFKSPDIVIYSQQDKINPNEKMIISSDKSQNAKTLYDGDYSTAFESHSDGTQVTIDAGKLMALDYIKFIPNEKNENSLNSCVGTVFSASKDNKTFYTLGTIEPDEGGSVLGGEHFIEFSGYGEFRYFRVEFLSGGSLCEIEWIANTGFSADTSGRTTIDLMAYDVKRDFSGLMLLEIFDSSGVLKNIKTLEPEFLIGEYTPIEFSGFSVRCGDYIRILTYDKDSMVFAGYEPLDYRYTDCSKKLSMSNIYSDNMMFQADEDMIITGYAPICDSVTVSLINKNSGDKISKTATVNNASEWEVNMGVFKNGGNYAIEVKDNTDKLFFDNITFGDVWVFAGQSNMEFCLCSEPSGAKLLKSREKRKEASNSDIRLINMYRVGLGGAYSETKNLPLSSWQTRWSELNPESAAYVSAISYYFAQGIHEKFDRNVGIISIAVGDTEINRWVKKGESYESFKSTSGNLYNNRIYPFTKMKVKGILWYQGEADYYKTNMTADEYSDAMACLIDSYREAWGKHDLPFYYAQLTGYGIKDGSKIRDGQRMALKKVSEKSNVGMISLIDIIGSYKSGEGNVRDDIHPWQKEPVANRFINFAARDLYGYGNSVAAGPEYLSHEIVGDEVILSFKATGSLRIMESSAYADEICDEKIKSGEADDSVLNEFWVFDKSGKLYRADARIEDNTVVVKSDELSEPCGAAYAWGKNPEMPNLTDDSGLPSYTFSTDPSVCLIE